MHIYLIKYSLGEVFNLIFMFKLILIQYYKSKYKGDKILFILLKDFFRDYMKISQKYDGFLIILNKILNM